MDEHNAVPKKYASRFYCITKYGCVNCLTEISIQI